MRGATAAWRPRSARTDRRRGAGDRRWRRWRSPRWRCSARSRTSCATPRRATLRADIKQGRRDWRARSVSSSSTCSSRPGADDELRAEHADAAGSQSTADRRLQSPSVARAMLGADDRDAARLLSTDGAGLAGRADPDSDVPDPTADATLRGVPAPATPVYGFGIDRRTRVRAGRDPVQTQVAAAVLVRARRPQADRRDHQRGRARSARRSCTRRSPASR